MGNSTRTAEQNDALYKVITESPHLFSARANRDAESIASFINEHHADGADQLTGDDVRAIMHAKAEEQKKAEAAAAAAKAEEAAAANKPIAGEQR